MSGYDLVGLRCTRANLPNFDFPSVNAPIMEDQEGQYRDGYEVDGEKTKQ